MSWTERNVEKSRTVTMKVEATKSKAKGNSEI